MTQTIGLDVVFVILGFIISLASFYFARQANAKTQGEVEGNMSSNLKYIREKLDDLYEVQKTQQQYMMENTSKTAENTASIKALDHRIDSIVSKTFVVNTEGKGG